MNETTKDDIEFVQYADGSVLELNHAEMEKRSFLCDECGEQTDHLIVDRVDADSVTVCLVCKEAQPAIGYPEQDIEEANDNAGSWLDDI